MNFLQILVTNKKDFKIERKKPKQNGMGSFHQVSVGYVRSLVYLITVLLR